MKKPRTRAEKAEVSAKARDAFVRSVGTMTTWKEVADFALYAGVPAGAKQLYSNLAYFLGSGGPPFGANDSERSLYEELRKRLGPFTPIGF
jgi:hypothetical protein